MSSRNLVLTLHSELFETVHRWEWKCNTTGRKESWTTFSLQAYAYEYDSSRTAMAQPSNVYPCAMVEVAGGVPHCHGHDAAAVPAEFVYMENANINAETVVDLRFVNMENKKYQCRDCGGSSDCQWKCGYHWTHTHWSDKLLRWACQKAVSCIRSVPTEHKPLKILPML